MLLPPAQVEDEVLLLLEVHMDHGLVLDALLLPHVRQFLPRIRITSLLGSIYESLRKS